jgi:hypothetical protein
MLISRKSKVASLRLSAKVMLLIAFSLLPIASNAQCAMCRASLESIGDTAQAEAVNDGIVYLMAIPYILVGLAAVYIYKMYKKKKA